MDEKMLMNKSLPNELKVILDKISDLQQKKEVEIIFNRMMYNLQIEVDKLKNVHSSLIFTDSVNPIMLFSMASYQQIVESKEGVFKVEQDIFCLQEEYNIDCKKIICGLYYQKIQEIDSDGYIEVEDESIRGILRQENKIDNMRNIFKKIQKLSSDNYHEKLKKIIHPILLIDADYEVLRDEYANFFPHDMHKASQGEVDIISSAISFFNKFTSKLYPSQLELANQLLQGISTGKWYNVCQEFAKNNHIPSFFVKKDLEKKKILSLKRQLEVDNSPYKIIQMFFIKIQKLKKEEHDVDKLEKALKAIIVKQEDSYLSSQGKNLGSLNLIAEICSKHLDDEELSELCGSLVTSKVTPDIIKQAEEIQAVLHKKYLKDYPVI